MKKFIVGLTAGLVMGLTLFNWHPAGGATAIKLIVNGHIVDCDVPPMVINGRTMVPARFVAEPLGATVTWNESMQAVIISTRPTTTKNQVDGISSGTNKPTTTTTTKTNSTTSKTNIQPKTPTTPTEPTMTIPDETDNSKSGLQGIPNPFAN
ncbi:MAG: copper amine oxidase N-terminal domain-containing protein [Methylocystaceae bacterium]